MLTILDAHLVLQATQTWLFETLIYRHFYVYRGISSSLTCKSLQCVSMFQAGQTVTDFQRDMLIAATSQAIGIPAHHINAIAVPTFNEHKIGRTHCHANSSVMLLYELVSSMDSLRSEIKLYYFIIIIIIRGSSSSEGCIMSCCK